MRLLIVNIIAVMQLCSYAVMQLWFIKVSWIILTNHYICYLSSLENGIMTTLVYKAPLPDLNKLMACIVEGGIN
jgi:hypothetical protein